MSNNQIQEITYRKKTGLYKIVRGSIKAGRYTVEYTNNLTDEYKQWAKITAKRERKHRT